MHGAKSREERQQLFADLKKTPHLLAAFLKIRPNAAMSRQNSAADLALLHEEAALQKQPVVGADLRS